MKDERFYKGIDDIKKIEMDSRERQFLLSRLLSKIEKEEPEIQKYTFLGNVFMWNLFSSRATLTYATLFLVILTGGSTLVIASNKSIPGDVLYPLKVNVNEPLQGVTMVSTASKVDWEATKIQNRLEEIEVLVIKGRLDATTREEIQNRLDLQTKSFNVIIQDKKNASSSINLINETDPAEIDLEAKIGAHDRILEKLQNHSDDSQKQEIEKFRSAIMKNTAKSTIKASSTKKINTKANKNKISTTTFEAKEKTIEALIKDTQKNLSKRKSKSKSNNVLQKDILKDGVNDLQEAREALTEARKKKDSGNLEDAYEALFNSRLKVENANISIEQGRRLGNEEDRQKKEHKDN